MNPPLHATHHGEPVRIYHIENGTAYVVLPDGTAECVDWKALRFPKDPAFVAQAPAVPALLPVVRWAEWVEVNESTIRRPGVSQDGTEHWQSVVFMGSSTKWAWLWHNMGSLLHEQEGYSEREWARKDCEAYTAGKTAPADGEKR